MKATGVKLDGTPLNQGSKAPLSTSSFTNFGGSPCGVSAFDTTSSNQPHKPRTCWIFRHDHLQYHVHQCSSPTSMRDEHRISHWIVPPVSCCCGPIGKSAVTHWLVQVSNIAPYWTNFKSLTNWSCNINHQLKWCFSMGNARLGSTLKICCWCL